MLARASVTVHAGLLTITWEGRGGGSAGPSETAAKELSREPLQCCIRSDSSAAVLLTAIHSQMQNRLFLPPLLCVVMRGWGNRAPPLSTFACNLTVGTGSQCSIVITSGKTVGPVMRCSVLSCCQMKLYRQCFTLPSPSGRVALPSPSGRVAGMFPVVTSTSHLISRSFVCSARAGNISLLSQCSSVVGSHVRHFSLFNSSETVFALSSGHGKCGTYCSIMSF